MCPAWPQLLAWLWTGLKRNPQALFHVKQMQEWRRVSRETMVAAEFVSRETHRAIGCHCYKRSDEAIRSSHVKRLDCFASLETTTERRKVKTAK
jgi:hypothetical protein